MGKIFGISDLPVTIFTTPLEPVKVPKYTDIRLPRKILAENFGKNDLLLRNLPVKTNFINRFLNRLRNVI
jgi:hypothetical protein